MLSDLLEGIIEDEDLAANLEAPPLNPKLLTAIQGVVQFIFLTLDPVFRTRIRINWLSLIRIR